MKQLNFSILLLLTVSATTGCAAFQDGIIDSEIEIRNHTLAQSAWNEWSWCYDDLDHPYHFAKGFKAGYRNILDGGNGCQPTLPPRCYWKPKYQTPDGRMKVYAWFDGYSHGALAAKQDGYGGLSQIPISPTAQMNLRMANSPAPRNAFSAGSHQAMPAVGGAAGTQIPPTPNPILPGVNDGQQSPIPVDQAVPLRPYE